MRPGAPTPRPPARYDAPDIEGSYTGPSLLATCRDCRNLKTYRGVGGEVHRCRIAVDAAARENRRLPGMLSPKRRACSQWAAKRGRS